MTGENEMSKRKVYVVLTSSREYYTYDLELAERAARQWHGELHAFANLDAALKEFNLTPLDEQTVKGDD